MAEAEGAPAGLRWSADYTVDVAGPVAGGRAHAARTLDDLMVAADLDLGRSAAEADWSLHLALRSDQGGQPNALVESLQGVDNIEVEEQRARVFEAWVEAPIGASSLRAGLYDLNSEFYNTPAAGLLIAPPFGIGSELAATGPNGPSIFPSTALAIRLRLQPRENVYLQAAALNAHAGVLGDPGGVDLGFGEGALLVAESGWTGRGKLALGGWRYTTRQPALSGSGQRIAQGVYLLVEQPLGQSADGVRAASAFVRLGVSDGETSPYGGGGQAGLLVDHVFAGRPQSQLSAGAYHGVLTGDLRRSESARGRTLGHHESGLEFTYADRLLPAVTLQPSVQYLLHPGGDQHAPNAVVLTLRARIHLH